MQISIFGRDREIAASRIDAGPEAIREQVREYETGERTEFDLEIEYPDDFTGQVMRAMTEIPAGETRTYGDIARELESAPIAVGQACGRNQIPIIVPCHRIVGVDSLTGYGGGLDLKRELLEHEGAVLPGESA
ncbi:methylated-DNA--[protein]-cysteine S-methyltransferase [Natronorubrum texcoconense]|uniref:methylated-DNA--[protein]-cysteine S-methyltransferase n=1 Tax=Natronorubrum texcoconense TaxID=1095776 RepID=A0A1G9GKZ2_9EURY|nr:methylated-DNA--[protein]-cysteine S-methyltransferase [Natronorubrum texcoconense]SDL01344.1 methylated-DNA-[protein]-cysteine S-methyltransferase [Natronorubrum texcoconense]